MRGGLQLTVATGTRLFKTEAFMVAHPFGTVPAAFSPGRKIAIFESNSARAKELCENYTSSIRTRPGDKSCSIREDITLADICVAAELVVFMNEHQCALKLDQLRSSKMLHRNIRDKYPPMIAPFDRLLGHKNFSPDLRRYVD